MTLLKRAAIIPLTIILLISVSLSQVNRVSGDTIFASLGNACTAGCALPGPDKFTDGTPYAPGNCVTAKASGQITHVIWNLGIFVGTPNGTMQVKIYTTTGTPGAAANCTPPTTLIGFSEIMNLASLSGAIHPFNFIFTGNGIATVSAGQNIIAAIWINATDSGQIQLALSSETDNNQNSVIFSGSAWGDNAKCQANCEAYSLLGSPGGCVTPTDPACISVGGGGGGGWPYLNLTAVAIVLKHFAEVTLTPPVIIATLLIGFIMTGGYFRGPRREVEPRLVGFTSVKRERGKLVE